MKPVSTFNEAAEIYFNKYPNETEVRVVCHFNTDEHCARAGRYIIRRKMSGYELEVFKGIERNMSDNAKAYAFINFTDGGHGLAIWIGENKE